MKLLGFSFLKMRWNYLHSTTYSLKKNSQTLAGASRHFLSWSACSDPSSSCCPNRSDVSFRHILPEGYLPGTIRVAQTVEGWKLANYKDDIGKLPYLIFFQSLTFLNHLKLTHPLPYDLLCPMLQGKLPSCNFWDFFEFVVSVLCDLWESFCQRQQASSTPLPARDFGARGYASSLINCFCLASWFMFFKGWHLD